MMPNSSLHNFNHGQRGFVLIFALVILVTLTLLGFMASRTAVMEMTLSNNERLQRQTFSVADGGTMAATRILRENMDCNGAFSAWVRLRGQGAIQFVASPAFAGDVSANNYTSPLPAYIRTAPNLLPPVRDPAASPEIVRQVCIGGEGINTVAGGPNGCTLAPNAAGAGAPHTNILFNKGRTYHLPGEDSNNTATSYDIYSQHVAYNPGNTPTVTRESIILMGWGQKNDPTNNCIWQ